MNAIEIENISKIYGEEETQVIALDSVSLSICVGEFLAVTGSSGSGKSTMLHIIGGVDVPDSGTVKMGDTILTGLIEPDLTIFRRRNIGIIYQFYNLIPTLSAIENITLPCLLDKAPIEKDYLNEIIDLLNLHDRLDHLPSQLSGGQQQRVAIARALINRPKIVLADEPTGNLDKKNSGETIDLLRRANSAFGQTIIIVTHDAAIASSASRTIRIEDGRLVNDTGVLV